MANPFAAKFKSQCQNCGAIVEKGIAMYAANKLFICEACAEEGGFVCKCGNFKKAEYDSCFTCSQAKRDAKPAEDAVPEWDPWASASPEIKKAQGYTKVSMKIATADGNSPVTERWDPPAGIVDPPF